MILGVNSGCFYQLFDRFSSENLGALKGRGCPALELSCHGEDALDRYLAEDLQAYSSFSGFTIHAPSLSYGENDDTYRIFDKLRRLVVKFHAKNVVFHPDTVGDWDVFKRIADLPVSIENMDERKPFGRTVSDIQSVLDKYDFLNLTLDVQHCYVNDPSMHLATEFHEKLGDRIVEYHLSGFEPQSLHYPLSKLSQDEIIEAVKRPDVPIIIESTFIQSEDLAVEVNYLKNLLSIGFSR